MFVSNLSGTKRNELRNLLQYIIKQRDDLCLKICYLKQGATSKHCKKMRKLI